MVYRLTISDLEGHLPKAYIMARALMHLGLFKNAYVVGIPEHPRVFAEPDWVVDLTSPDAPIWLKIENAVLPKPLVMEFQRLPLDDLDAMAQLFAITDVP